MTHNTTVSISGLSTGYRHNHEETVVTADINASLRSGELTCLLGPNGAGKSTLLRTLSAFQPPISGKMDIEGHDLQEYKASDIARLIGIVLTEKVNTTNMTVEDLVAIGRSPYTGFMGTLTDNDRQIIDDCISMMGIDNLKERKIHTLSDGERQKAMIAKALAQQTPIILLDEPTAFLDYPSKAEIMQLLRELAKKQNKTIFLSTHDLELALQISDRIWLLDKKLGLKIGNPEDLSCDGDIERYFRGAASPSTPTWDYSGWRSLRNGL